MNNNSRETLNAMMLAAMRNISLAAKVQLYNHFGSATAVLDNRSNIVEPIPKVSERAVAALKKAELPEEWAEREMNFCLDNDITILTLNDVDYPQRLRLCEDAPIVLYFKGNANLNAVHIINVIGTRHATIYGQDCIRKMMKQLRTMLPDVLVVSGLAYGIDICAHRNALEMGFNTVGVLAHGLDDLYPHHHRQTALEMLSQGGLLTEHPTRTAADKKNFVSRNRIVAGMSDATVLVESAAKGGGLITSNIALSYHREVMAFPGRAGDQYSEGCNNMIAQNKAHLITSADDLLKVMNWENSLALEKMRTTGIERQLFPQLSAEEQGIVDVLQANNDIQINELSADSNIPIHLLSSLLFEMEMKGIVRPLAGGVYHLIG